MQLRKAAWLVQKQRVSACLFKNFTGTLHQYAQNYTNTVPCAVTHTFLLVVLIFLPLNMKGSGFDKLAESCDYAFSNNFFDQH